MKLEKVLSLGLAGTMMFAAAGCGQKTENTEKTEAGKQATGSEAAKTTAKKEVEKPKKLTIMVDGTLVTQQNARDKFEAEWEKITGIDLEIIQPDHDAYYDVLGQTFAGGQWPDVVLLGSTFYPGYAGEGILWDMTQSFENSEFKKSGRLNAPEVVEGVKVDGKLYGLPATRGNGCVTYVKKAWLDKVGMQPPTTFDEYMKMLEAFTTQDPDGNGVMGDTYGVSSAGIIGKEAPFTNYLPEFYQDANTGFIKNKDGKWIDGFLEPNMEPALERLTKAYASGVIDKESLTNGTKDCRNKFYEDKFGAFTYWAGKWNTNMKTNLEANKHSGELIALKPIAGLDTYLERTPPVWAITSKAKNPEGVYNAFFETMFDGKAGQTLWTYGVKGVHWDDKAEKVVKHEYKEGEFHMLESLELPGTQYTTAHIDPLLSIADFEGKNPGENQIAAEARASQKIFNENSKQVDLVKSTEEMSQYNGDLTKLKQQVIANVVTQGKSYKEEMARFEKEGGKEWSKKIVDSLNK